MKLVFYEIKKVLSKKVFFIILILCLIINTVVFYYVQNSNRLYTSADYTALINEYCSMPVDEAEQKLRTKSTAYEIMMYMDMLADADSDEQMHDLINTLDEYKTQNPAAYAEVENMASSRDYQENEETYIYDLISQIEYIKSYPDFIDEMHNRADEQASFSIFSNQNNFSYKNLYKTSDDYNHLSGIHLSMGNNLPVTTALNYKITDYLLIATVFLVCIYIFYFEKDKGLYNLVRSSRNGRLKTAAAKLAALFIITAVISIIFALSNFAVSTYIYGKFDLSRSIQSIPDFRNCIFKINTGQFCLLAIASKAVGMITISAVFAIMFVCFSNPSLMYITSIGVIVAEYLLSILISSTSALNYFKYINIFYLLDGYNFWGNYLNLNIFTNPIAAHSIDITMFAIIFVVCTVAVCIIFTIKKLTKTKPALSGFAEKFKARHLKINGSTGVFSGETYKYLVQNKIALLLIALVAFSVFSSFGTVRYPYSVATDVSYKNYMEYLEGDITEEKIHYISEQNEYFEMLRQRAEEIAADETLSENAKSVAANSIQKVLENDGEAFARVTAQYERLLGLQENGINARFIDENLYPNFVYNSSREWENIVLILLILIISVPFVYTVEYKNGMIDLVRCTKYGKLTLMRDKLIISVLTTLITFSTIYLPYLIRFINTFGTNSLSTKLVCLEMYQNTDGNINIIGAFTVIAICYLMIALLATGAITLVSVLCKNHLLSMIISTVIVLIPCLVIYSFNNTRAGAIFYGNYTLLAFSIIIICICLASLITVISTSIFTNTKMRRKNVKP